MLEKIILIPNYNGVSFIGETIRSFQKNFSNAEIIVVDDASTDDSVNLIKSLNVTLLKRNENGGFAAAINTGLRYFLTRDSNYIIISNSDIIMSKDVSTHINTFLNKTLRDLNNKVGIVGFREENDPCIYRENINVSGFFFCLNLRLVKEIGYLDEKYIMYGEEQDYFRRALLHGYEIVQSNIEIPHIGEMSGKSKVKNSWFAMRNAIRLEIKFHSIYKLIKSIGVMFLIINRIYKPPRDNSVVRLLRPGLILGNVMLLSAIIWNIVMLPLTIRK